MIPVAAASQSSENRFEITNASKTYNFVVSVKAAADSVDDAVEGPGSVRVIEKRTGHEVERLSFENIFLSLDEHRKPLANANPLYDYQGVINVGDFNFDGHEDFAVQTGNEGPYGAPSYQFFLFDPKSKRQEPAPAFDKLVQEESLGFPNFVSRKHEIRALTKSGCCRHWLTTYAVQNNRPVPVAQEEWIDQTPGKEERIKRIWSKGAWRTVSDKWRSVPSEDH